MKKLSSAILLFAALNYQPAYCQESNVEKDVYVLLEQFALALNNKDVEKATSYFLSDPFFQYISDGFAVSKEEWMKFKKESLNRMAHYSFRWTDIKIKTLGKNSAVATCESLNTYRIIGGPMGPNVFVFTISFEKIKGRWYMINIHESPNSITNEIHK